MKRFNLREPIDIDFIVDFYEEYLPDPTPDNNTFVEIGVGHTVNKSFTMESLYDQIMCESAPEITAHCGSNTLDLLDHGFRGIYIDPVIEFLWELGLLTKGKKAIPLNYGCSNKTEIRHMFSGESLLENPNHLGNSGIDYIGRPIMCMALSDILDRHDLSGPITLMSIDAEGMEPLVLEGIREEHLPKLMILETTHCGENSIHDTMVSLGYELKYKSVSDSGYVR